MDMLAVRVELSVADIAVRCGREDGLRPPGRWKVSRTQLCRSSGAAHAGRSGKLHGSHPKTGAAGIQAEGCGGVILAGDRARVQRAAKNSGTGKDRGRGLLAAREGRVDLNQSPKQPSGRYRKIVLLMIRTHEQYALGRSRQEYARLARQGEIMRPMTKRLFAEAGISSGMRVVDPAPMSIWDRAYTECSRPLAFRYPICVLRRLLNLIWLQKSPKS